MCLAIQVSPRSTTTVEELGEHDDGRQQIGDEDARCPFKLPVNTDCGVNTRPMHELNGPIGWPIIGNFLTYLKTENQGKMHEVQVSTIFIIRIFQRMTVMQNIINKYVIIEQLR